MSTIDLRARVHPDRRPLDDAIVAALVLRYLLRRTDRNVLFEHLRASRQRSRRSFTGGLPVRRVTERLPGVSQPEAIRAAASREAGSTARRRRAVLA